MNLCSTIAVSDNNGNSNDSPSASSSSATIATAEPRRATPNELTSFINNESIVHYDVEQQQQQQQEVDSINTTDTGPYFLRPRLLLSKSPTLYYGVIILNFILRMLWTAKLSIYLQVDNVPISNVYLNTLEIFRRWVWIFFRIEKEAALAPA